FQSQHLRPTGFTFEACALELCKPKVDELIAKFRPVLQTEAALTETRAPTNAPMPTDVGRSGNQIRIHRDHHEFPAHQSERQPKARRPRPEMSQCGLPRRALHPRTGTALKRSQFRSLTPRKALT